MEDIQQKILRAISPGDRPLTNGNIRRGIERLCLIIKEAKAIMREIGMAEHCHRCDTEEGGSCCGRGIEAYYDEPILLLNYLMGANLHVQRRDKNSCLFLSKDGCILIARHAMCVNYLCEKLTHLYSPQDLTPLRAVEGEELELTFKLCEDLRPFLL